ncbi:tetratricopeptide repeat protein [uncultured Microscilla sp.]|uniref:tetratricopeptide repeat protein n=1 Tax=uncultured Microscilla sp. TaxID=432653 RepID=UPI00260F50BC|nr:tetratricopeptide repeat protein [uncultured Microscilla sp.]
MMKQVSIIWVLCLLVGVGSVQGQTKIPKRPNKTDTKGLKKGKWIILYDKHWKVTFERDKTEYYRLLSYKNGKPVGEVKDYYKSGVLQSEIDQLIAENPDKFEGKGVYYHYNGKKHYEALFENGVITQIKYYNQDGSLAQPSWQTFAQQATQLYNTQKWTDARKMFERARVQSLKEFPPNSEKTATTLYNLGLIQFVQKNYKVADSLFAEAITIFSKTNIMTEYTAYGTVCFYMGQLKNYFKKTKEAAPFFEKATTIYSEVFGEQHVSYATAAHELANIYVEQGKYAKAKVLFEKVKSIYGAHPQLGKQHIKYAMVNLQLGTIYNAQGDYKKAIELYKSVRSVYEKVYGKTHFQYATLLVNWANAYRDQKSFKQAKSLYEEGVEILEKMKASSPLYYAGAMQNFARLYHDQGAYDEAESRYKQALVTYRSIKQASTGYVDCLSGLMDLYTTKASYEKAQSYYKEVQRISKAIFPQNHPKLLFYSNRLGNLYQAQGKYQQAESVYISIVQKAKKIPEVTPLVYASYLGNLASNYLAIGAYKNAKRVFDEATQVYEKNDLNKTQEYGISLLNIALLDQNQGKYKQALEQYKRAGNIFRKVLNKEHILYYQYLIKLGKLYTELGKQAKAKKVLQEVLETLAKLTGTNNLMYASVLEGLANLYQRQNLHEKSEQLYKKVLRLKKAQLGKQHPKYAETLGGLGSLHQQRGKYVNAELCYEEGLEILKRKHLETNKLYTQLMLEVGALYFNQRKFEKAQSLYREVKKISEKNQLTQSQEYLSAIYNLAYTHIYQQKYRKAEAILQDILKRKNINDINKPGILMLQGELYKQQARYDKALSVYQQAEKIARRILGTTHQAYASVARDMGWLYSDLNKHNDAIRWFNKASGIYQGLFGKYHRAYLNIETAIVQSDWLLGNFDKATKNLSQVGEAWFTSLRRTSIYMNEQGKKKYFNSLIDVFSIFKGIILAGAKNKFIDTVFVRNTFNLHLAMKSFLLSDVKKMQELAIVSIDTLVHEKYERYTRLKAQIAVAITLSVEEQKQRGVDIQKAIAQVQKLEKELSLKVGVNAENERRIKFDDIRKALKPDEAALTVLPYKYLNPQTKKEESFSFFLIVTAKTSYPEVNIMQYKTNTAQTFVKQYQKAIQSKQTDTLSYGRFWSPIATLIKNKGIKKVYFSPDGVYHQLNVSTLQNPVTGKYVGEEVELHLVNNLKDIVKFKTSKTSVQVNNRIQLFARPAYDLPIEELKKAETALNTQTTSTTATTPLSAKEYKSGKQTLRSGWSDLPGTEVEIRAIEKVLREQKAYQVVTRLKEQALEKAVKNVASPKILHIATHGFFIENFKAPTKVTNEEVVFDNFSRGGKDMNALRAKITREEPMLRSGIVLAGASSYEKATLKPNTEDGILTAYEASALDLRGTDLVTLSACETGLGEIENGEGVYGLQRAFMVAGAKSLLMSLWKVDDTATQLLMSRFYKEWIGKGKSKRAAFRAAQEHLRNYKKAGKKIYAAPYYWGAFVMVGE